MKPPSRRRGAALAVAGPGCGRGQRGAARKGLVAVAVPPPGPADLRPAAAVTTAGPAGLPAGGTADLSAVGAGAGIAAQRPPRAIVNGGTPGF